MRLSGPVLTALRRVHGALDNIWPLPVAERRAALEALVHKETDSLDRDEMRALVYAILALIERYELARRRGKQ